MAATGYTPIQLYRTSTSGASPTAGNLNAGELAINYNTADMSVWALNTGGSVVRLMNNPAGLKYPTTDGTANQVMVTNGSGVLSWATTGAVTSVGLSAPSFLSVSGSPVTSSGTLALSYSGTALPVANGGTGTTTPSLVAGTNVTISGTWPNQTINASGGTSLTGFTGATNTALGVGALTSITIGGFNTAIGKDALRDSTTGTDNTAMGTSALLYNTIGKGNSAFGQGALAFNTTGSGNSAFGPIDSTGGYNPVFEPTTENNRFCMGSAGVTNAYIQVAWTVVSDARDKTNFAPVPHGLEFVNQLKPTAYQFKEDRETDVPTGIVRYGFKAQDILELEGDNPVIIDNENLDKLRFNSDSLIPVLVNAIKELSARVAALEVSNEQTT